MGWLTGHAESMSVPALPPAVQSSVIRKFEAWLAKDSIINTLVTVTSAEDLRVKKAFHHLSSPATHKQIEIFKKMVL